MKRRLKLITVILIFFAQCGIPSNELFKNLNTPKNLSVTHNGSDITIVFTAYNPEQVFSGYNVYMHASSEAELRAQRDSHVVDSVVDVNVEINYIVENVFTLNYPTVQDSDNIGNARTTPSTITYTIIKGPNQRTLAGINWFIGVTAYSTANHIESGLSEIIQAVTP